MFKYGIFSGPYLKTFHDVKHGTSVAPQVVERINTLDRKKFRNVGKISNLGWEPSAQPPPLGITLSQ